MLNLKYSEDPIRVAIYARVSSDAQDVNNSIEAQIAECEQFARNNNMAVVVTFIDEAESGRSDNRLQFQKMVAGGDQQGQTLRGHPGMEVLPLLAGPRRQRNLQEPAQETRSPHHFHQGTDRRQPCRPVHGGCDRGSRRLLLREPLSGGSPWAAQGR